MPIEENGWEFHIIRKSEQRRASDGKRRTVGRYQIFHEGIAQTGAGLSGTVAETRGPGANSPAENNRRVEEGRYPLFTQDGEKYVTIGYKESESTTAKPKPGIELKETTPRTEILIHPGQGFLASIGCINPCTSLPNAAEMIDFVPSRKRVIAIIDDLKAFAGSAFPTKNGKRIPNAFVVIDGEPQFQGWTPQCIKRSLVISWPRLVNPGGQLVNPIEETEESEDVIEPPILPEVPFYKK